MCPECNPCRRPDIETHEKRPLKSDDTKLTAKAPSLTACCIPLLRSRFRLFKNNEGGNIDRFIANCRRNRNALRVHREAVASVAVSSMIYSDISKRLKI